MQRLKSYLGVIVGAALEAQQDKPAFAGRRPAELVVRSDGPIKSAMVDLRGIRLVAIDQ